MAHVEFDSSYAPCGFLIVPEDGDMYDDETTTLIQSDWDYPGVAQAMGWSIHDYQRDLPNFVGECEHSGDGTVTCDECGATAGEFISAAFDYILAHECEEFEGLDDYLPEALP